MMRPQSTDQQQPSQRRTKKRKGRARTRHKVKEMKEIVPLEVETLERLKQVMSYNTVLTYDNGFHTFLGGIAHTSWRSRGKTVQ